MKLWLLGSGSSGNAVLVECDGTRAIVDCGFGTRTLAGRLQSIGVDPRSIDACLLTHEHNDHVKGAASAARRWGWELYATPGTAQARELAKARVTHFSPGEAIELPRMTFHATRTPHDASESVGFVVTGRSTGVRAGLFYDMGHVSRAIAAACQSLDLLVLESNHDDAMLRNGPYPRWLQARIAGNSGHLSNHCASAFARTAVTRGLTHLVLAHLSEICNTPRTALAAMRAAVARTPFRGTITAAQQHAVVGPFVPGGRRSEAPVQYTLF